MQTAILVGCGKQKRDGTFAARNLYTSSYFEKKMGAANSIGGETYILSAEYGLVDPAERIERYDTTIDDVDTDEWADDVVDCLLSGSNPDRVVVFAGKTYRNPILERLPDTISVVSPFDDTSGIGEQLSLLDEIVTHGLD